MKKPNAIEQLCPACGMCCNGVLFGDVELQPQDKAAKLAQVLQVRRKGKKSCFSQPCTAFDGSRCGIYDLRPIQCRAFECRLLQKVQQGAMESSDALKKIAKTRSQVEKLLKIVRGLGNHEEHVPLNKRCAKILREPEDLTGDPALGNRRGQLLREMNRLMELLQKDFL